MSRPFWRFLADMTQHARIAYSGPDEIPSQLNPDFYAYVPNSFQTFTLLLALPSGDQVPAQGAVFATVSSDGKLIIAFRGSDDAGDLLVDSLFAWEVAQNGYSDALLAYAGLFVNYIKYLVSLVPTDMDIVFTGHSLGGMIAEQFTQWYYDPTDPHTLEPAGHRIFGVGIGSPGIMDVDWAPAGRFYHVHRAQDLIGGYAPDYHIGPTIKYYDPVLVPTVGLLAHNIDRYALQLEHLAASDTADFVFSTHQIVFLPASSGTVANVTDYDVAFGGDYNDTILTFSGDPLVADGGGGADILYGSTSGDKLAGAAGGDSLAGGLGNDHLFGGDDGDRYSIGVYEGYDIIDDRGAWGSDIIAVSSGNVFSAIDYDWFQRDGNDLLILGYATDGSLALNIRIVNMNSSAGRIELFNLYAGDGNTLTQSWDLGALWAGLTQPEAPSEPVVNIPSQSSVYTAGNDNIVRGGANDVLTTRGQGQDSADFGGGSDTLIIDYFWTDQRVNAWFDGSGYRYRASGIGDGYAVNVERVVVVGSSAGDGLSGTDGSDILSGELGDDSIHGSAGDDTILGGADDDYLIADGGGWDWYDGGSGIDRMDLDLSADTTAVRFVGELANSSTGFTLYNGTHIRNVEFFYLLTGSGNDEIWVQGHLPSTNEGWNNDEGWNGISSGVGDDTLHFSRLLGLTFLDGESGTDSVTINLTSEAANLYATYYLEYNSWGLTSGIWLTQWGPNEVWCYNTEHLTLFSGAGNDVLTGVAGTNHLDGGDGDDTLIGGSGSDWLDGGSGNDYADLNLSAETRDVAFSSADMASGSGVTLVDGTHVQNVERVLLRTGSGDDTAWFGALSNNSWQAGNGTDRLIVDFSSETTNIGTWFWNSGSYANGFTGNGAIGVPVAWNSIMGISFDSVEALTVTTGSGNDTLYGGNGSDIFTANGGNDYLVGQGGDDTLDGGGGNDTLDGGAGFDTMVAGDGDDLLFAGLGGDWLDGGSGNDYAELNLSADTRAVTFSSADMASSSGETLVDGTHVRNVERVYLRTGSGEDTAWFGALTNNSWQAGNGTDRLIVDFSSETTNIGTWFWNSGSYANGFTGNGAIGVPVAWNSIMGISFDSVEALTVTTGSGNDTLYGGNGSDIFTASGGNDFLYGQAGNDTLNGGDGNDVLDGGIGSDKLRGGAGDDSYIVDKPGDAITELAGGGADSVQSSVSYTLAAEVENLTLTGAAAINGTGNALANAIIGNSAVNWLNGMAGADTMTGGGSSDTYIVDNVGDRVVEVAGGGEFDTVRSAVSFTLGDSLENLILTGATATNATGNALNNVITGNGAANRLDGSAGADKLKGGAGNDTYIVDRASDVVIEDAGAGTDTVQSSATYTLGGNVENLILTGASAVNAVGNAAANVLTGNAAANVIQGLHGDDIVDGGGGNDQIYGGTGHDDLTGGAGADGFRFNTALNAASNVDDILDFSAVDDTIYLSRAIFAGIAVNGTLAAGAFRAGTVAADADDRILYDSTTGRIYYDSDGTGAATAVLFATVTAGTALTNLDFVAFTG